MGRKEDLEKQKLDLKETLALATLDIEKRRRISNKIKVLEQELRNKTAELKAMPPPPPLDEIQRQLETLELRLRRHPWPQSTEEAAIELFIAILHGETAPPESPELHLLRKEGLVRKPKGLYRVNVEGTEEAVREILRPLIGSMDWSYAWNNTLLTKALHALDIVDFSDRHVRLREDWLLETIRQEPSQLPNTPVGPWTLGPQIAKELTKAKPQSGKMTPTFVHVRSVDGFEINNRISYLFQYHYLHGKLLLEEAIQWKMNREQIRWESDKLNPKKVDVPQKIRLLAVQEGKERAEKVYGPSPTPNPLAVTGVLTRHVFDQAP